MYLLDALHSRAGLMLVADDDGVEFCHGLVPRFGEVHVFVRLRKLRLSWDSLLLLGVSGRPAGPLLSHAVFIQDQSGLGRKEKHSVTTMDGEKNPMYRDFFFFLRRFKKN